MSWDVQWVDDDAGAFHSIEPEPVARLTFVTVRRPTLVLGSAQTLAAVDTHVARALGVSVVERRSGGGAVLLVPGEFVWADVVVPTGHPRWSDDAGQAMMWLGDCWVGALASLGVPGRVHRGAMRHEPWSRAICWTGLGTGEVVGERGKLVGISQRRTRRWARLQSMVHLRWRPELVAALAAPPRPAPEALAALAQPAAVESDALAAALVEQFRA